MPDFLLELRSEEIPARMQAKAREDLARLFTEQLAQSGLAATAIETHATPRRLALIARGLSDATQATAEEIKGPRADAPPQALAGFLGKVGLTRDQLVERTDTKGNAILFAVMDRPGRPTADVLAEAIPAIIRAFPWPKSMRWGAASASTESPRWVRPLQGIVALLGEAIVPFEVAGVASGAATVGHRFHHPGIITIGGAHDYAEKLRACHVTLDADERATLIRDGARAAAAAAGLALVEDEALVAENAGLTEWPVPLLGRFDAAFLDVPREVIQLTMRTNQKYFACTDAAGDLAPNFVCTANIEASDGGAAIVAGNERVLSARLADAKFFWEADLKVPLDEQVKKLGEIVFHEKLGTVADKVDRVAKLARWLVEEGIVKSSPGRGGGPPAQPVVEGPPSVSADALPPHRAGEDLELATLTERAARLCKADLVTQMVGEFPELQGIIGAHLALAQGEDPQVAAAIRDHYKPVGQGDDVPTAPVTVAVSLADKLDTLSGFLGLDLRPSGSKDPFALRRSAISAIRIIQHNGLRCRFAVVWVQSALQWFLQSAERLTEELTPTHDTISFDELSGLITLQKADTPAIITGPSGTVIQANGASFDRLENLLPRLTAFSNPKEDRAEIFDFLVDRLKVQQREAGVRHDLIDAVFALGGEDDLVRLLARVHALQAFVETPEGRDLLAGYKRAANILKKEGYPSPLQGSGRLGEGERGEGESKSSTTDRTLSNGPVSPAVSPEGERGQNPLSYTPEPVESSLIAALDSAELRARSAVAAEDFAGAMAALATLRVPVDAFFDSVTVNDPDPARRAARLALLARLRDAVHGVADFSKIEG